MTSSAMRAFMTDAKSFDTRDLLSEWQWLVPPHSTPIMISIFGDWVLGAPDGSLLVLSVLEGTCERVAKNAAEFNTLKEDSAWMDQVFLASWQEIAARQGLVPTLGECLGWKIHPLLGGKFDASNLQIFSMRVYQYLMGQLHRQARQAPTS